MNCRETQERWLESLENALAPLEKDELEEHISECADCAQFAEVQTSLDLRLREAISVPQLSSDFSASLRTRIAQQRRESWPEWLPDAVHLIGSGVALWICALVLPFPAPVVLGTGGLVAIVTYSLQTLLITTLEQRTK